MSTVAIRYFVTRDNVRLAYWSQGRSAVPLLYLPSFPTSHLEAEWEVPGLRRFYEDLSSKRRLVRYDYRGVGLSDRHGVEVSLDKLVADVEDLAGELQTERIDLLASQIATHIAIAVAARRPDFIGHLILWHPSTRVRPNLALDALTTMAEDDWDQYLEARTRMTLNAAEAGDRHMLMRNALTPEFIQKMRQAWSRVDVSAELPLVKSPTLVIRRRGYPRPPSESIAEVVSGIKQAEFAVIDGDAAEIFNGDVRSTLHLIDAFLADEGLEGVEIEAPNVAHINSNNTTSVLTKRELEVLRLLIDGHRGKEIALLLGVSLSTVERHIANIYAKTGRHGRAAVAAYAVRQGLLGT